MPVDLVDRKLAKRFQLLDVDGDGFITSDDYDALTQRLLDAYPERAGSPVAERLREGYRAMWQQLAQAADEDGDGRITPEEYREAVAAGLVGQAADYERVVAPVAATVLELADTDGNGVLSLDECRRLLGAYGVSGPEVVEFFRRADTDGDGELSVRELAEAEREFLMGSDPDAAGSLLFGSI